MCNPSSSIAVPLEIDDSVATIASANNTSNSSQDNSDDFVLVPSNLPVDPCSGNYDKRFVRVVLGYPELLLISIAFEFQQTN